MGRVFDEFVTTLTLFLLLSMSSKGCFDKSTLGLFRLLLLFIEQTC